MESIALQSEDHRQLLDIIDQLRFRGISKYVDLPEIVVCGDQSAGKSSVLEAISGMSFPTKDNLCTRFATELILRRDSSTGVKVSISPGLDRSEHETEHLASLHFEFDIASPDLGDVIEKAKEAMGLSNSKVFSTDILRVELRGPTQPHLTMVDLPGLFRAGNKDQSVGDATTVRQLVRSYMRRPRSILLAVVSAKSDFALQDVTELAREVDPRGMRTLGLITKPDTLDAGSDSEYAYVKLAQNKDVIFRLGWHVLRNRDYEMRDVSSLERDNVEKDFFAEGIWTSVNPAWLGVKSLKHRLGNVLMDQILRQLPSLLHDVELGISACHERLNRIGSPRSTLEDQHRYLLRFGREFSILMKSAVDGMYNSPFFGTAKSDQGYHKRLRAVVQNTLTEFEETMRLDGEARIIVDNLRTGQVLRPREILRSGYVAEVKQLMRKSRGCELPGTFNPLIIGELFTEQCQPWRDHATKTKDHVFEVARNAMVAIIRHLAVEETTDGLVDLASKRMDSLRLDLDQKVAQILEPYFDVHPITYNHYLTDSVQKAQSERRRDNFEATLEHFFEVDNLEKAGDHIVRPSQLLDLLSRRTEADMESYASDLAIDYVESYYKVALKRFVDDFSVLGIEQCLIRKLPSLFDPEVMHGLTEKDIAHLAAESKETADERGQCAERLAVLEAGLRDLRCLDKHRFVSSDLECHDNEDRIKDEDPDISSTDMPHFSQIVPDPSNEAAMDVLGSGWDSLAVSTKKSKKAKKRVYDIDDTPVEVPA